jgi:small conductance mechanosensitive channel
MGCMSRAFGVQEVSIGTAIVVLLFGPVVQAQVPGLPTASPPTNTAATGKASSGMAPEKSKPAVAASSGPITVRQQVSDKTIQQFLAKFLPKYPGIHKVRVTVDDGVVTLAGRVDDDDTRNEVTDVVKRVEGVRLVLNQLNTDDEVMTAWEFAARELGMLGDYFARKWLLILLALAIVVLSALLARLFAARSEVVLAPFVHNVLLRSVVGSIISSILVIGGLLLALGALRLTHVVASIVGVAGMVGLAITFAFRDITENFIASVLLGVRRPFQIGDYVTIAGQSGIVKSLNTRATVLVTLEGNHVRIPNSTIFKEIMVNTTASPSFRNSFDVVIPNEASASGAIDSLNRALREQKGILSDPPPRALVEALEPGGVRIRAYFWSPTQNVDSFQLMSDAKLRAKVALQQAGAIGPTANAIPDAAGNHPGPANGDPPRAPITLRQAAANLNRDTKAADSARSAVGSSRETPMERVLDEPETRVSTEGANLLKGARAE